MTEHLFGLQIPVLDKGFVQLVDFMPHPVTGISGDMAIVSAARVSFLGESKGEEADKKLLFYLMRNHHDSPFEMVTFKLRVKAPLVTFWQWVRHRMASYNAQSGRYTEFSEGEFYIPDEWRLQSVSNKQGSDGVLHGDQALILNANLLALYNTAYQMYEDALSYGVAKEQARLFLPGFSVYYTWIVQMNARSLMNFLMLRTDAHAQYEIRVYADAIYTELFKPLLPWTAQAFEEYVLKKP